MSVDLSQYKTLYVKTVQGYNTTLTASLPTLKNLEDLHRRAHSLKSESIVMQYPHMATLYKLLEDIFASLIEKKYATTEELITLLHSAARDLEQIEKTLGEGDVKKTPDSFENLAHVTSIRLVHFS